MATRGADHSVFDLAELDSLTSKLDLAIGDAAQTFYSPIRVHTGLVASSIETPVLCLDEGSCSLLRSVDVACGQLVSTDNELSNLA